MGTEPSRRTKGREQRRARMIETAMQLAHEGGYEAVQMRAVADRSDVALGTIYRHFSGKDELLIAGLVVWLANTRGRIEAAGVKGDTPEQRLSGLLERSARATDSYPTLIGALVTAMGTTSPSASTMKLEVEREVHALVATAIGSGAEIDTVGVARVVGHVWSSALTRWVSGLAPDGSVAEELRHAVQMLVGERVSAG